MQHDHQLLHVNLVMSHHWFHKQSSQKPESDGEHSQQERTLVDEGAFAEESSNNNDLQNYRFTLESPQRLRLAPTKYDYANLVAYALTLAFDSIEAKLYF